MGEHIFAYASVGLLYKFGDASYIVSKKNESQKCVRPNKLQ